MGFVQAGDFTDFGISSIAAPVLTSAGAGNAIAGIVWWSNPTGTLPTLNTISDGTNTYVVRYNPTTGRSDTGGDDALFAGFYAPGIAAGSPIITATFSGTADEARIISAEYSGPLASGAFDNDSIKLQNFVGSGTDFVTSDPFVTVGDGDLIIGFCTLAFRTPAILTAGTAFGTLDHSGDIYAESRIQSVHGSVEALFSASDNEAFHTYGLALRITSIAPNKVGSMLTMFQ